MPEISKQKIVLIHGRGTKPNSTDLKRLWVDALTAGLQRDAPKKVEALQRADIHMIYYANHLQHADDVQFDEKLDMDNRRQALQELSGLIKAKEFRRKYYEELPGKTALKEFAMDLSASVGLGGVAIKKAVPELKQYWNDEHDWPIKLREEVTGLLAQLTTSSLSAIVWDLSLPGMLYGLCPNKCTAQTRRWSALPDGSQWAHRLEIEPFKQDSPGITSLSTVVFQPF